jgi:tetratricopeptide (TPR) repeat protein
MTPEEAEEHDRVFREAVNLVKEEILVHPQLLSPEVNSFVRSKLQRGLKLLGRALELNPRNWPAMWFAGKIYQRLGEYSIAFQWFIRALEINPLQADVEREASLCAMSLGFSDDSISHASSALKLQPSDPGLHSNLAFAYLLAGKLTQAKLVIDKAIAIDPKDAISCTVARMIDHFVTMGRVPPSNKIAFDAYWNQNRPK